MGEKSKHFHLKENGCKLIPKRYFIRKERHTDLYLFAYFCKTHQKEKICRCGWEFGRHFGTNSIYL